LQGRREYSNHNTGITYTGNLAGSDQSIKDIKTDEIDQCLTIQTRYDNIRHNNGRNQIGNGIPIFIRLVTQFRCQWQ
jgi:hypothetical protein